jgi:hypothetical protein
MTEQQIRDFERERREREERERREREERERQERPRRALRKRQVGLRYGGVTDRTVDRWAADGKISKPFYRPGSRIPLWWEHELDECDREATRTRPMPAPQPAA